MAVEGKTGYGNAISRQLDGMPVRPEEATVEMIEVAEKVTDILIDSGFSYGWYGDTGKEYRNDQVNWVLLSFVSFAKTQKRPEYVAVSSVVSSLNCKWVSEHNPDLIKKYAHLNGYALQYGKNLNILGVEKPSAAC